MSDPFDKANEAKYSDAGWDGTVPAPARVDITGGVLKQHPSAVVARRQHEAGINYEVRLAGHRPVHVTVEWGDDEGRALAYILDRLA